MIRTATVEIGPNQRVDLTPGDVTDTVLRANVVAGIRHYASRLAGSRSGAAYDTSEEAAIAEISRAQLSGWAQRGVRTAEGTLIDAPFVRRVVESELDLLTCGTSGACKARYQMAAELFIESVLDAPFGEFLEVADSGQLS